MLLLLVKTMIINKYNITTSSQQIHNNFRFVAKHWQQSYSLLCNRCSHNFFFHCKLNSFYNKTTKN
ncbi:hypothetical protein Barb6XT_02167 [Bacteroidales bacterium Barb6XT]|nr:hypothetical protein Barb6XT_02167 [Bacteroidales bacterium Barb6XT]